MSFLNSLFNRDEKILKQYNNKVQSILELEPKFRDFKEEDFKNKTSEFKERLKNGETLDDILVEAFALARQACKNVINEFPYPCQLVGGIALHEGNIAEMKTGEGKTLTSVMPVYLNALAGKGVHVVTVNEYLAKRDSEWMGQIHRYLGLTVGYNTRLLSQDEKRAAYACDITYSVNTELAFDYLRDNMVIEREQRVLRGLNFALVDEVDSILIDEARTPLIISGGERIDVSYYKDADRFVKGLIRGKDIEDKGRDLSSVFSNDKDEEEETGDYSINIKSRSIQLTANGISKAEKFYHVDNLFDQKNEDKIHYINQALRARYIMQRDVDYVVDTVLENKQRIQKIVIIDQNTGRKMEGREYSDGLHQAIEAKENVPITHETSTIAVISYQNFFRLYEKLCGMTGTAKTEEEEFLEIYNMRVISIPTNRDVIRIDEDDCIYISQKAKFDALIDEIKILYEKGQPVLVGTISVDTSDMLSKRLKQLRIQHEVLNAKNHAREAEIIAGAGQVGRVTIATNMAGRGTDIKLSPEAKALGGLVVLGSERHESRRIDNQLRGRSGRQGDPGRSKFFVSFEDDLMKRFGASNIKMLLERLPEETKNQPITAGALTKAIGSAQKRIEGINFDTRKNLLDYDNVLAQQRETMYEQRNYIIDNDDIKSYTKGQFEHYVKLVYEKILRENENNKTFDAKKAIINYSRNLLIDIHSKFISRGINSFIKDNKHNFPTICIRHKTVNNQVVQYKIEKIEKEKIRQAVEKISSNIAANDSNIKPFLDDKVFDNLNEEETVKKVYSLLFDFYDSYAVIDEEKNVRTDNRIILQTIDKLWSSQIDTMNKLRENIQFRGYAQNNPLQAYTEEGYNLFSDMINNISIGIVNICLSYTISRIIDNYYFDSKIFEDILYITVSEGKE